MTSQIPPTLRGLLTARVHTDGDHLIWGGPMDRVTPYIKVRQTRYGVRHLVLEHALGRAAIGQVCATCEEPRCIAPEHLLDLLGRRNTDACEAIVAAIEQAMPALLAREAQHAAVAA